VAPVTAVTRYSRSFKSKKSCAKAATLAVIDVAMQQLPLVARARAARIAGAPPMLHSRGARTRLKFDSPSPRKSSYVHSMDTRGSDTARQLLGRVR
jgi:hypothetical protein